MPTAELAADAAGDPMPARATRTRGKAKAVARASRERGDGGVGMACSFRASNGCGGVRPRRDVTATSAAIHSGRPGLPGVKGRSRGRGARGAGLAQVVVGSAVRVIVSLCVVVLMVRR